MKDTTITASNGAISLNGTGGEGTNIEQAIGVRLEGIEVQGEIKANAITITGNGGTSNLRRNALNENGVDTFQQTANNVGVVVDQFDLEAKAGDLSVTGTGGALVLHETANDDNTGSGQLSTGFNIEGLNINDATTISSRSTFLKGSAGQPISGDRNRGTTITDSTITTATDPAGQAKNASTDPIENRIEGNAFSGTNDNYGLSISNTDIESNNQDLTLAGSGGLKATGEKNFGIYIGNQSSVRVGDGNGSKNLNIYGAGGDGTDMTGGILTENTDYTVDGNVKLVGTSQGAGEFGNNSVETFNGVSFVSTGNTSISGSNDVNITDTSIDSGGNTDITAGEDLNITDSDINTQGDTTLAAGNDVNVTGSNINSGGTTDIGAGNNVNVTGSTISSGDDTSIAAGNDVNISDSSVASGGTTSVSAGNDINLTNSQLSAEEGINLTAGNQLNIQATDLISNSINLSSINSQSAINANTANESASTSSQNNGDATNIVGQERLLLQTTSNGGGEGNDLVLNLSGNVNYFPNDPSVNEGAPSSSSTDQAGANETDPQSTTLEASEEGAGSTTTLSPQETNERHNETEAQSAEFVATQLGLKPKPPMTIPAIQQLLENGQRIMNMAGR